MVYGYARVSTAAQDESSQVRQLRAAGCGKVFREKIIGATADLPQLGKLTKKLALGAVVITPAVDRLSRDTTDLLVIAHEMQRAGPVSGRSRSLTSTPPPTLPRSFLPFLAWPRSSNAAAFLDALRTAEPMRRPRASNSAASRSSRRTSSKRPASASTQARRNGALPVLLQPQSEHDFAARLRSDTP